MDNKAHSCVCFVSTKIAESEQTVTLGGVSLFFNKWRISDMGLQTISALIANLSCHQQIICDLAISLKHCALKNIILRFMIFSCISQ